MHRPVLVLTAVSAALTIAAIGLLGAAPADAKLKRLNIGSNPAGSVYFLLAGGFAKMFQKELKIRSTAQPHAGSSVYIPLMDVGEIVLDAFLGSGTTVLAAEKTARRARAIELDPQYVDVAIRRWQALTGDAAIHESTGQSFAEREEAALVAGAGVTLAQEVDHA